MIIDNGCPTCGAHPGASCTGDAERSIQELWHERGAERFHPARKHPGDSRCLGCGDQAWGRSFCVQCREMPAEVRARIKRARERGLVWELSAADALALLERSCSYCGEEGGTIDRVDSDIGYVVGNVVPCCLDCNMMKRDTPLALWLEKVHKVASWTAEHPIRPV